MLKYYKIRKRSTDEFAILSHWNGPHYTYHVEPSDYHEVKHWIEQQIKNNVEIDFSDHQILAYEFTEVPSERWILEIVDDIRQDLIVQRLR